MTKLKGILIDPEAQSIRLIEVERSDTRKVFDSLYELIGNGCDIVEHVYLGSYPSGEPWVVAVLDEEGLLKDSKPLHFFRFKNGEASTNMLAGRCVVLGLTEQGWDEEKQTETGGEYMDCPVSVLDVHNTVEWVTPEDARKFRDGGGFDTKFAELGPDLEPVPGTETSSPIRPPIAGIDAEEK